MKPLRSLPDAGSTLAEVDYYTGRITRIPGVYPFSERIARYRPMIFVAIAALLFVVAGIAQAGVT